MMVLIESPGIEMKGLHEQKQSIELKPPIHSGDG